MEKWLLIIFILTALFGMIFARKLIVSRINRMDSFSMGDGGLSSENKKASDIWNDMGNKREFLSNDVIEKEDIDTIFIGLSDEEITDILDEVLRDG